MNILLNVLEDELQFIGGDQTYYRNLEAASHAGYGFNARYLSATSKASRQRMRYFEVLSHKVNNQWLKSRLLAEGRRVPVDAADLAGVDIVVSAILAARLPRGAKVANAFLSQGINAPDYYHYLKGPTVEAVAAYYRQLAPHVTTMIVATHDGLNRLRELCPNLPCQVAFARHLVLVDGLSSYADKEAYLQGAEQPRLLFVGRDYVRKGLPEALEAYQAIADKAELHIVTVENCPLQAEYAKLPNVHWYSRLSNEALYELYSKSHVLVATTHADTYNLSMVEAMAYGCAIITSDLAPMDEIAPAGVVGEIVPRGNVEALRAAMSRLVDDADLLRRYSEGAIHHFQAEHSPKVVIRDTLAAFESAIKITR